MSEGTKRKLFAAVAVLVALGAVAWVSASNLGENLVYYWSPSELNEKSSQVGDATIRLGGMVRPGTMTWDKEAALLTFSITDGRDSVQVQSKSNPPQMFREGVGCVVEGQLESGGVFQTERIMVKHSNEYRAPEEGERAEDMYRSLVVEES